MLLIKGGTSKASHIKANRKIKGRRRADPGRRAIVSHHALRKSEVLRGVRGRWAAEKRKKTRFDSHLRNRGGLKDPHGERRERQRGSQSHKSDSQAQNASVSCLLFTG